MWFVKIRPIVLRIFLESMDPLNAWSSRENDIIFATYTQSTSSKWQIVVNKRCIPKGTYIDCVKDGYIISEGSEQVIRTDGWKKNNETKQCIEETNRVKPKYCPAWPQLSLALTGLPSSFFYGQLQHTLSDQRHSQSYPYEQLSYGEWNEQSKTQVCRGSSHRARQKTRYNETQLPRHREMGGVDR